MSWWDRLDRLGRALDAAGAREKLAEVLTRAARREDAVTMLGQAAVSYRAAGALEHLGQVAAHIGDLYAQADASEAGIQLLQPLVPVLEAGGPSAGLAAIHLALSDLFYRSGRYTERLEATERAAAVARALQDDRLLAAAEAARGSTLQIFGRLNEGLLALQEAMRLMEACGDLDSLEGPSDFVEYAGGKIRSRVRRPRQIESSPG